MTTQTDAANSGQTVLVHAEIGADGALRPVVAELLGAAATVGVPEAVLVTGAEGRDAAVARLGEYGATRVHVLVADDAAATLGDAAVQALAAATDNVGLFFGEDIFVAFGSIVLMQTFLAENGIVTDPLHIALWGIPTAIAAFVIHAARLLRLDRQLPALIAREGAKAAP